MGSVPVVKCKDLASYITSVYFNKKSDLESTGSDFPGEISDADDTPIEINFAGDRGGGIVKFHFEIVNCGTSGSVFDVHIFSMYEASDCAENMEKVLREYWGPIRGMQGEDFKIDGRNVKIFLGGDLHLQDDCLGKQGSSATYPSALDMVELSHLQNHPVGPHTPESCPTELRTTESYENFYQENLCEDRREGDLNATGKYHGSVVRRAIFPLSNLENLVPPVLHITLGIVLRLFNMLERAAMNLDSASKKRLCSEKL